jgi:hypothetical protein
MEKKKPKALMAPLKPMARMAPKMSRSQRRRILEAEGRMQQGQTGSVGPPIDVSASVSNEGKDAGFSSDVKDKDKAFGMKKGRSVKKKKKGYAMGGKMKKGYAKGGKVRGAGIARKGVRPAKMR